MSAKNKKQFGIWMDSHHATIVGRDGSGEGAFAIIAHEKNAGAGSNSNENAAHNLDQKMEHQFFKAIAAHMQNVDELYVTGTGQAQEQFIHFMAETAQYKNTRSTESTSAKMSDEKLVEYIAAHFN